MKLKDLIFTNGGIIISVTGVGLGFFVAFMVKEALPNSYPLVGIGGFLAFTISAFVSYHHTVNKKSGDKRES